jgi:dTMP kinase
MITNASEVNLLTQPTPTIDSPREKKLFIVLEGIDGSGTSTQANLLKDYLIKQGETTVISPEPSEGVIGKLIREALQNPSILAQSQIIFDQQMCYLFAADRHYHLYNQRDGVFKKIEQDHCHVITPRYYFSSLAYNSQNSQEFEFIYQLNQKFPDPDLVIYIDIPIDVSLQRLSERTLREVYENREKLERVQQNYQKIFSKYMGKILVVKGTESKQEIHQKIVSFIENKISSC